MSIARLIEVAEHNGFYTPDGALIVMDGLVNDRYYGVRIELDLTTGVPGWHAYTRDGVGTGCSVWAPLSHGREAVVTKSLNGYLDIVNHGI